MPTDPTGLSKGSLAGILLLLVTLVLAAELPLAWLELLPAVVAGAGAGLSFRRAGQGRQHERWAWCSFGAALLLESGWAFSRVLPAAPWSGAASAAADPMAEFGRHGLTLGGYLFALISLDRHRSTAITGRLQADIGLVTVGLATALTSIHGLQQVGGALGWNPLLAPVFTFVLAAGPLPLLLYDRHKAVRKEHPRSQLGLVAAFALSAAGGALPLAEGLPWGEEGALGMPRMAVLFALAALGCACLAAAEERTEPEVRPLRSDPLLSRDMAAPAAATALLFAHVSVWFLAGPGSMSATASVVTSVLIVTYAGLMLWRLAATHLGGHSETRALHRELAYLNALVDNINEAVVTEDPSGKILLANREFYRLFGLRNRISGAVQGEDFVHLDDLHLRRTHRQRCLEGRTRKTSFAYRGLRADGVELELETSVTAVQTGGVLIGVQWVIQDVSSRRLIEKSRRAMAERLEFFVSEMPLGCIIWDPDSAVQEWNESAQTIFGWSHAEVQDRRYGEFLAPPEDRDAMEDLWKHLRRGKTVNHRQCENLTRHRGKVECEWFHTSLLDESGEVVAVASMVQDVTERKMLERQLLQSQKMEAVGTLAGGIAHDFNNLLTTIIGHLSLALMKLGPAHAATRGLQDAERAAERAAELIRQMLRFSRKSPATVRPVNANECIEQVARLLAPSIDPRIKVDLDLAENLWLAQADGGQLEQVLMNLIVNARDAVSGQGVIRIASANTIQPEKAGGANGGSGKGEFVQISVTDSGSGMDTSTQSRVFEPFFTTKEVGKGTGLGLAMVYAIIKNHRGWVEVASQLGEGSVFRIFLPRTEQPADPKVATAQPSLRAGVETILLADDDASVRALARQILEGNGYPVIEAGDGQEAVEMFRSRRTEISVVILDLIMPRQSGWEAFDEIHKMDPDLPVIMSSGFSVKGGPPEARQRGVRAFLSKPYKAKDLLSVVQEVLDGKYSFESAL